MKISRLVLLIITIFLLLSCGRSRTEHQSKSNHRNTVGEITDGGTLVVGIRSEPESLNPLTALSQASRNIIGQIFSRLANINEDLVSFTPVLAKRWEFSDDHQNLIFHLQSDVTWHDGHPFTAQDVLFTYQMHVHPAVAWDGISYKENISNVTAPNDSTVIFSFYQKNRTMLLDATEGYILPKHLLEKVNPEDIYRADFNHSPVGTGPFRFNGWVDLQTITLVKNDNFFVPDKPHLDRIIFQIVPDNFNLLNQLKSGDVDMVEGVYPKDFLDLAEDWEAEKSAIRPVRYLGRRYDFIGWNLIDPQSYQYAADNGSNPASIEQFVKPNKFFGDQKVRAALTMALDRNTILKTVNFGAAIPLNGPIAPILPAYTESANTVWEYDPTKAKQYLSESGWIDRDGDNVREKDDIPFEFELLTIGGSVQWEQVATIVQEQLWAVGISVKPRFMEPALLYGKLLPIKDFDAVIIGWTVGLTPDFAPLFHSKSYFTPFHFNGYFSREYDRLDDAASAAITEEDAQPYYNKIAELLSYELPYTWLYYRQECSAVHCRFKNIKYDKRGIFINLEDWWIPENERTNIDRAFAQ